MQIDLTEVLFEADRIYEVCSSSSDYSLCNSLLNGLGKKIRLFQSVSHRLAYIYNKCIVLNKSHVPQEVYPEKNEWVKIISTLKKSQQDMWDAIRLTGDGEIKIEQTPIQPRLSKKARRKAKKNAALLAGSSSLAQAPLSSAEVSDNKSLSDDKKMYCGESSGDIQQARQQNQQVKAYQNYETVKITDNIAVNVGVVEKDEDMPNTKIYWIKSEGQFGIRINGIKYKGNIGNIYKQGANKKATEECRNYRQCFEKNFTCDYYHDPSNVYVKYYMRAHKKGARKIQIVRNFGVSSWMYSDQMRCKKNRNMRHIGNRNTLSEDLSIFHAALKDGSTDNADFDSDPDFKRYKSQIIHDLLVATCISQYQR